MCQNNAPIMAWGFHISTTQVRLCFIIVSFINFSTIRVSKLAFQPELLLASFRPLFIQLLDGFQILIISKAISIINLHLKLSKYEIQILFSKSYCHHVWKLNRVVLLKILARSLRVFNLDIFFKLKSIINFIKNQLKVLQLKYQPT